MTVFCQPLPLSPTHTHTDKEIKALHSPYGHDTPPHSHFPSQPPLCGCQTRCCMAFVPPTVPTAQVWGRGDVLPCEMAGVGHTAPRPALSCLYIMAFVYVRGYFILYKRALVQNGVCVSVCGERHVVFVVCCRCEVDINVSARFALRWWCVNPVWKTQWVKGPTALGALLWLEGSGLLG